ncbi:conserved membrane hypothetical protein [Rubrivivax sp. A210]|nr:conserved membrane hypothetical protein [Rubrivivax sp. A210]
MLKMIPSEVVGLYMALAGFLGFAGDGSSTAAQPVGTAASAASAASAVPLITQTAANTAAASFGISNSTLIQFVFFVLLIGTPLYLVRVSEVKHKGQLAVATVAFAIWAYTLGGPFVVWNIYSPTLGSVLLLLWTFFVPMFVKTDEPAPVPPTPEPPKPPGT